MSDWWERARWLASELREDVPLKVILTEALAERERNVAVIFDHAQTIMGLRAERDLLKECLFQATTAAIDLSSRALALEAERDHLRERVALLEKLLRKDRDDADLTLRIAKRNGLMGMIHDCEAMIERIDAALRGTP